MKTLAGILLLALGVGVYGMAIVSALIRMHRQYSRALHGAGAIYLQAILTALARTWPAVVPIVVGVVLLVWH